ncbi:MAG: hypothetical protein JO180_07240 [Gemmatirosa sp.]|nr:hypothetical protein [Gemmatirosa sp.]
MHPISPAIDPQAHRAAIDALEAQRAAYRRFARDAEAQQGPLAGGDLVAITAFTDSAAQEVGTLHEGAHAARKLVDEASKGAQEAQLRELERRMSDMTREARNAETAIRNLSTQLEAWRDAYGRQLTELGISPGGTTPGAEAPDTPARRTGYGAPAGGDAPPRILDRKG